jgi:hypothetical protein
MIASSHPNLSIPMEAKTMSRSVSRSFYSKALLSLACALLPLSVANMAHAQDQAHAGPRFESVATPQDGLAVRDNVTGTTPSVVPGNSQLAYSANAAVGKIVMTADKDNQPADGHSVSHIVLQLYDKDGQLLQGESYVTVELGGTARLKFVGAPTDELGGRAADEDRATPGSQHKVVDGVLEFDVLAPTSPGDVDIRATAGAAQVAGKLSYLNELRPGRDFKASAEPRQD